MARDELQPSPEQLLSAYAAGVFPMAESRDDPELFWVDPRIRGVLPLDGLHLSRSLRRRIRQAPFAVTLDRDFAGVVSGCADRDETWISDRIADLYAALHEMGHAHSIELWDGPDLAGGVYGVTLGGAFFGESMFSARRDASKLALAYLVDHLRQSGFTLFDTQFVTPHLASMGAVEIPRPTYRAALARALGERARFGAAPIPAPGQLLQRMTQIS